MKWLSVDSIQKNFLVCEDDNGNIQNIFFDKLPPEINEGSIIIITKDGKIKLDIQKTEARRKLINKLYNQLYN